MLENIKQIIQQSPNYIIFKDGIVIDKKIDQAITVENNEKDNIVNNKISIYNNIDINIVYLVSKKSDIITNFFIPNDVDVSVIEYIYATKEVSYQNNIDCNNDSKFKLLQVIDGTAKVELVNTNNLKENSYIDFRSLNIARDSITSTVVGNLENKYCDFDIYLVDINNSKHLHKYDLISNHHIGYNNSTFRAFGIIDNSSDSIINTKGVIKAVAEKANIDHNIKGILLDFESSIIADPALIIDNFDVSANHGASVGDLDDDDLYYLMSRGLNKVESQKLILGGLVNPILDGYNLEESFIVFIEERISKNL